MGEEGASAQSMRVCTALWVCGPCHAAHAPHVRPDGKVPYLLSTYVVAVSGIWASAAGAL